MRFDFRCRASQKCVAWLLGIGLAVGLGLLASLGLRCGNYELAPR